MKKAVRRIKQSVPATREIEGLFGRVTEILEAARGSAVRSVNSQMVLAYWSIGREIVQSLQGGDDRAEYGQRLVQALSDRLTKQYGRGFSTTNLRYFRMFHLAFAERAPEIRHIASGELEPKTIRHTTSGELRDLGAAVEGQGVRRGFSPALGWSHYRALMVVEHQAERLFYETEAEQAGWSVAHLERQIHTLLFARLFKSRNKAGVLALAQKGQEIRRPTDMLKDPYVLDFLDLPDGGMLRENELEAAIISQIQHFLLELGKGFAFVARQKRLSFEDEHFYVDLVFYHTILKSLVALPSWPCGSISNSCSISGCSACLESRSSTSWRGRSATSYSKGWTSETSIAFMTNSADGCRPSSGPSCPTTCCSSTSRTSRPSDSGSMNSTAGTASRDWSGSASSTSDQRTGVPRRSSQLAAELWRAPARGERLGVACVPD